MQGSSYKDLKVWQKAIALTNIIYDYTDKFPVRHRYTIGTHIEKSCISIPSNIAEGKAKKYTKDFKRFLLISMGSCAELDTQLIIALNRNLINENQYQLAYNQIEELVKMMRALINSM